MSKAIHCLKIQYNSILFLEDPIVWNSNAILEIDLLHWYEQSNPSLRLVNMSQLMLSLSNIHIYIYKQEQNCSHNHTHLHL